MPSADALWTKMSARFRALFLPDFSYSWRRMARSRLLWIGERVRLEFSDAAYASGLLKDIGPEGDLILQNGTGTHSYLEGSLSRLA